MTESQFVLIHAGAIGEAPLRFFQRNEPAPEFALLAALDVFRALNLPEGRDTAVLSSLVRDYPGEISVTDDDTIVVTQPVVGELVQAACAIGTKFSADAWGSMFAAASTDAMRKVLAHLPPDVHDAYCENAMANTMRRWKVRDQTTTSDHGSSWTITGHHE